ncbi:ISAon1 family transposase N-terminal region protein [Solitalea lacus]
MFLHVKRRRWMNLDTQKVVYRNWEAVAKGTRITKDFAAFLKAISRY